MHVTGGKVVNHFEVEVGVLKENKIQPSFDRWRSHDSGPFCHVQAAGSTTIVTESSRAEPTKSRSVEWM